jgi:acetyl esterase/lipase
VTPRTAERRAADAAYGPDPRQALDVYGPPGQQAGAPAGAPTAASPAPVIVFFYGGGWNSGARAPYRFVAESLAAAGFVVAIPDYRLVPAAHFPDFVDDGAAAVAWVRAHAAALGGDPQRIVLAGHSAGAYIALMLTLDPRFLAARGVDPAAIAGTVALSGPTDFLPLRVRLTTAAFGRAPDPAATQPMTFVRGDAPPLLLLHGGADRLVDPRNSTVLAERVAAAGGRARAIVYDGVGHIDILAGLSSVMRGTSPLLDDIAGFVGALPQAR